jgi:hypothetical protein
VPQAFFKIIFYVDGGNDKAIAFLIPHLKGKCDSYLELEAYLVPIDAIEKETGLDLLGRYDDIPRIRWRRSQPQSKIWRVSSNRETETRGDNYFVDRTGSKKSLRKDAATPYPRSSRLQRSNRPSMRRFRQGLRRHRYNSR